MRNVIFSLLAGFLFAACSDDNSTNFYAESSSSEAPLSSSAIGQSSSNDIIESSSSFDAISSTTEISSSSWPQYSYGELIDERDGQIYKTIKIGEQTWMAENLNYAYLQPTSTKDSSSECYNNELDNCSKFGRLYLWSAAMDSAGIFSLDGKGCGKGSGSCKAQPAKGVRGVCPENWHIPTESDMSNYVNYANSSIESLYTVRHYWINEIMLPDFLQDSIGKKHAFLWSSVDLYGEKFNENSIKVIDFTDIDNLVKITKTLRGNTHAIRCVKDDKKIHIEHGELKDERDGQVYKTVKIGDQWWMAENLNYAYTQPINGLDSGSWCNNNDPENCVKYGRLYTWATAMDSIAYFKEENDNCLKSCIPECKKCGYDVNWQTGTNFEKYEGFNILGVCPENWHIPSVNEWKALIYVVNNFATDLKSTSGWLDDGNGSDIYGFRVLPAEVIGKKACFWTPLQFTNALDETGTNKHYDSAVAFCFYSGNKEISGNKEMSGNEFFKKENALSVRCIKDSTESE